jgi:hypothetical protein
MLGFIQFMAEMQQPSAEENMKKIMDLLDGKAITESERKEVLQFLERPNLMTEQQSNAIITKLNEHQLLGSMVNFPKNCIVIIRDQGQYRFSFVPKDEQQGKYETHFGRSSTYCVVKPVPLPATETLPALDESDEEEENDSDEEAE